MKFPSGDDITATVPGRKGITSVSIKVRQSTKERTTPQIDITRSLSIHEWLR